jgi:putative hydrolase of the HAD superfamily
LDAIDFVSVSSMTIKAVFFDAAGTLIKPARRVGESYAAIAARHGKQVAPAALNERFRKCFDSAPRLAFPGADPTTIGAMERNWWKQLVARVFEPWNPFDDFDDYFDELFAYFAQPRAWAVYPEVPGTLSALKERGLILSVISNFDSRLVGILDGLGAGSWFEHVFVSSRVGFAKPDARIFDAALSHHGLKPRQAIHVGDSVPNDLEGAGNAGLRGILIDRGAPTAIADSQRVTNLNTLVSLIDRSADSRPPA